MGTIEGGCIRIGGEFEIGEKNRFNKGGFIMMWNKGRKYRKSNKRNKSDFITEQI